MRTRASARRAEALLLADLPKDLLLQIFKCLELKALAKAFKVCTAWRKLDCPDVWRAIANTCGGRATHDSSSDFLDNFLGPQLGISSKCRMELLLKNARLGGDEEIQIEECQFWLLFDLSRDALAPREGGWGKLWDALGVDERRATAVLGLETEEKWNLRNDPGGLTKYVGRRWCELAQFERAAFTVLSYDEEAWDFEYAPRSACMQMTLEDDGSFVSNELDSELILDDRDEVDFLLLVKRGDLVAFLLAEDTFSTYASEEGQNARVSFVTDVASWMALHEIYYDLRFDRTGSGRISRVSLRNVRCLHNRHVERLGDDQAAVDFMFDIERDDWTDEFGILDNVKWAHA